MRPSQISSLLGALFKYDPNGLLLPTNELARFPMLPKPYPYCWPVTGVQSDQNRLAPVNSLRLSYACFQSEPEPASPAGIVQMLNV